MADFKDPLLEWKANHGKEITAFPTDGAPLMLGDINGLPVTPFCTREQHAALLNEFVHREGDVWLVTYLKSGTTWMQEIMKHFLGKTSADNPLAAVPWLEITAKMNMIGLPVSVANTLPSFEGRRMFKSHWWSNDHLKSNGKSKFVYVARNGLDVCVSFYHHLAGFPMYAYEGDLNDFFEKFMKGQVDFGSWWDHIKSWWPRRNDDDVLFLHFEDLKANPGREIGKLAKFVGVDLNEEQLNHIVDDTSFENMKKRPLFYDMVRKPSATKWLRGGRVGDGKSSLSADQIARFEKKCKEEFTGEFADFPWQRAVATTRPADSGSDQAPKKQKTAE